MKKKPDFFLLLFLGKKTKLFNSISISTGAIAKESEMSQQTISRKLHRLKEAGWVHLDASPSGCMISLTQKGISEIKNHFLELQGFFSTKRTLKHLEGNFVFGIGEGKYYISQKQYLARFKELLGFKPYLGTLNLIVDEDRLYKFLLSLKPIFIEGFETKERSFGSIKAFKVKVFNLPAAIIIPERTKHEKNTVEIIAPVFLRGKFKLRSGSKVKISAQ